MALTIAWSSGWHKLVFELDSKAVTDLIRLGCNNSHPCSAIIQSIPSFLSGDWRVKITYCFREANTVAIGWRIMDTIFIQLRKSCKSSACLLLSAKGSGSHRCGEFASQRCVLCSFVFNLCVPKKQYIHRHGPTHRESLFFSVFLFFVFALLIK